MSRTRLSYYILGILGICFCTFPPIIAVLEHFPLWIDQGKGETLSGIAVILVIIAVIPLRRKIKEWIKSPDACVMWILLWGIMMLFGRIIDGITAVAFAGAVGNLVGKLMFIWQKRYCFAGSGKEDIKG